MFAATVTLLAIYLLLHYSTRGLFACDLPDIYLVQAEHTGSGIGSGGSASSASSPTWCCDAALWRSLISHFAAYVAPPNVATAVAQATACRMNAVWVHDAHVRP